MYLDRVAEFAHRDTSAALTVVCQFRRCRLGRSPGLRERSSRHRERHGQRCRRGRQGRNPHRRKPRGDGRVGRRSFHVGDDLVQIEHRLAPGPGPRLGEVDVYLLLRAGRLRAVRGFRSRNQRTAGIGCAILAVFPGEFPGEGTPGILGEVLQVLGPVDDGFLTAVDVAGNLRDHRLVLGIVAQAYGLLELVPPEFYVIQADHNAVDHRAELVLDRFDEQLARQLHKLDDAVPLLAPALDLRNANGDDGDQPHREAFKSHCTPVHATVAAFTAPAHTVCSFSALVTKPIALPNSPSRGKSCETVTACCAMIVA